jgi:hypothetical protein
VILAFVAWILRRRKWRLFVKHPVIAWLLDIVLAIALILFWGGFAGYGSGWIPSLQLYLHIGDPGAAAIIGIPSLLLLTAMIAGPRHAVRRFHPPAAGVSLPTSAVESRTGTIPRLQVPGRWDLRSITIALIPALPLILFLGLVESWLKGPGIRLVALAIAAIFLFIDGSWVQLQLWAARARDGSSRLTLQRGELRSLGVDVTKVFIASKPVTVDVRWGAGPMTPVAIGGRTLVVWERVIGLPPSMLAGAAIDSLGLRQPWITVPYLVGAAALVEGRGRTAIIQIGAGVLAVLFVVRVAISVRKRLSVLRIAARSHRSPDYLRGFLIARWISSRISAARVGASRGFGRWHPAAQNWRRSLRAAQRFASRANIPPEEFQAIVEEVVTIDLESISGSMPGR